MRPPEDPRDLAYDVLSSVEERDAYADRALDSALQNQPGLDPRDRALVTELVYGVLRRRGSVDLRLQPHVKRPLNRLDPEVLRILRIGAYQILFLDRVPDHAAVNESVNQAKRRVHPGVASLVNGCLRSLCREKGGGNDEASWMDGVADVPQWLQEMWTRELGEERAREIIRGLIRVPETWVRANTLKTDAHALADRLRDEGVLAEAGQSMPGAVLIREGGDLRRSEAFRQGWFLQQDISSQAVVGLLDPQPGDRVLDLCAAPGIKTTQIAEKMRNRGVIVAVDIYLPRLRELALLCSSMGISIALPVCADAGGPRISFLGGRPFDRILVDAPCSGLGILRRNPERKWRPSPDFDGLRKLQQGMLHQAASRLGPAGVLVYSTCTVSRMENEGVVEGFLRENRDFVREDTARFLPGQFHGSRSPEGDYCSWLGTVTSDLFFASRLRRLG